MIHSDIYSTANLLFIRFDAPIEDKSHGHKKIGGTRPAYSKITEQIAIINKLVNSILY